MVPSCQSRLFAGLQALPALAADRKSAARKTTTFVLLLYHRQHPTFAPLLPNRQKSRVRGFSGCPSGRLSRRERQSPINTPGSRGCGYKTASGRRQWPNRDPIGEQGGYNQYGFVANRPTYGYDPQGLTIYVCSRKSNLGGVGNHSYFYDSSAPAGSGCKSCGTAHGSSGSSGSCNNTNCPDNGEGGPGTPGTSCQAVPNSDGATGQNIMSCCKANANNGVWAPPINDCHTAVDNCLNQNGYNSPNNPRTGPPSVGPITPTPAPPDPEPLPPENPWGCFP